MMKGLLRMKLNKKELLFLVLMFFIFFTLTLIIPFNKAPDEGSRYLLAQFMYNHNALPVATDIEVRIPYWGISYATSPYLSYMISAVFMRMMSLFSQDPAMLLLAARFASVLFSTITVYFVIIIAKELFGEINKWIFITLCSCLPFFVYIASYVNTDALAMMSTSIIIYAWIIGAQSKWNKKSCIVLSVGLTICLLSYKNAYGYILVSMFLYIYELYKAYKEKQGSIMIKKGILIAIFVTVFGGWFYFRNLYLYGDFFGDSITNSMGETYAIDSLKPSNRFTPLRQGYSLRYMLFNMKWIEDSYNSFIGKFEYMNVPLEDWYFSIYNRIFFISFLGLLFKIFKNKIKINIISIILFFSACIPVILSVFYSYTSDYQAQGRYCLPMLIPLAYFVTLGISQLLQNFSNEKQKMIVHLFYGLMIFQVVYLLINIFGKTYLL